LTENIKRLTLKKAIYSDLCKKDPYCEFKMPSKKGKDPNFLEQSEIDKILNYIPANAKLQEVKDLFIFQMFTGLAVVVGHEVAHAVAKHANERMSQQMLAQYGAAGLGSILSKSSSSVQTIGQSVFGLGAQYGALLPFSRQQESEADHLGLIFMAIAGYNPSVALPFWQRMAQQGSSVPEFMSDHPADNTRIANIQKELPEAMQYYNSIWGNKGNTNTTTPAKNTNTNSNWHF